MDKVKEESKKEDKKLTNDGLRQDWKRKEEMMKILNAVEKGIKKKVEMRKKLNKIKRKKCKEKGNIFPYLEHVSIL